MTDGFQALWHAAAAVAAFFVALGALGLVGSLVHKHKQEDESVAIFPIVDLSDDGDSRPRAKPDIGQDGEQYWFTATSAEVQESPWTYIQKAIDGVTTLVVRSDTGDPLCFITPHQDD